MMRPEEIEQFITDINDLYEAIDIHFPARGRVGLTWHDLLITVKATVAVKRELRVLERDGRFEYVCYASTFMQYYRERVATLVGDYMAEYSAIKAKDPSKIFPEYQKIFDECNKLYASLKKYDRDNDMRFGGEK